MKMPKNWWDDYPEEKLQIKLKYLEFLKVRFKKGWSPERIRREITAWSLREFPYLKIPVEQFGGSFDHSGNGIFIREHGFVVTWNGVTEAARKAKLTVFEYIRYAYLKSKIGYLPYKRQLKNKKFLKK